MPLRTCREGGAAAGGTHAIGIGRRANGVRAPRRCDGRGLRPRSGAGSICPRRLWSTPGTADISASMRAWHRAPTLISTTGTMTANGFTGGIVRRIQLANWWLGARRRGRPQLCRPPWDPKRSRWVLRDVSLSMTVSKRPGFHGTCACGLWPGAAGCSMSTGGLAAGDHKFDGVHAVRPFQSVGECHQGRLVGRTWQRMDVRAGMVDEDRIPSCRSRIRDLLRWRLFLVLGNGTSHGRYLAARGELYIWAGSHRPLGLRPASVRLHYPAFHPANSPHDTWEEQHDPVAFRCNWCGVTDAGAAGDGAVAGHSRRARRPASRRSWCRKDSPSSKGRSAPPMAGSTSPTSG